MKYRSFATTASQLKIYDFSGETLKGVEVLLRAMSATTTQLLSSGEFCELRYGTTYLLTYLLTPWCRVLLEKLTGLQLVKKFPAFHGTRRFITAVISVRHLSLSWVSPIQSTHPHPTSWRSILILSTHLRLGLPSGVLPSGFPTKTLYTPLSSPIRSTCSFYKNRTVFCLFGQL